MNIEKIILSGGCFWGVEHLIKSIDGIIDTEVGYIGGNEATAVYNAVKNGNTGHAESVLVSFNSNVITLEKVLECFFSIHDPTTLNKQGDDIGTQYRSCIHYFTVDQREVALKTIKKMESLYYKNGAIITEVVKASKFYKAEDYHQDYLIKNPMGYNCHFWRRKVDI